MEGYQMTLTLTSTRSLSYHTLVGFVHIIPRPTLSLGKIVDGEIHNLLTNYGDAGKCKWTCDYLVLFKPANTASFVYVVLGCGAILKFDYGAFQYMPGEGGRSAVALDRCELVKELPLEVVQDYSHLPSFSF
jgi:hypothetical protein